MYLKDGRTMGAMEQSVDSLTGLWSEQAVKNRLKEKPNGNGICAGDVFYLVSIENWEELGQMPRAV